MVVGTAEESESVGKDLERPFAEHQPVELDPLLQDPEDEVVLLGTGDVADLLLTGQFDQLLHRHLLQGCDVRVCFFQRLVAVGRFFPLELHLRGDLLGDRHRLVVEVVVGWMGGICGHGAPREGGNAAPWRRPVRPDGWSEEEGRIPDGRHVGRRDRSGR